MSLLDYPEPQTALEREQEILASIEKFLMEVIYPKLTKAQQDKIQVHIARGIRIKAAFEFAGVQTSGCIR